jgi:DNA-directed RNA polymerase
MTTLYNSAVLTRREGILEALKKKDEIVLHPGDRNIVSRACIESMSREFSKALELNKWFQEVAKAAMSAGKERLEWLTPSGMHVVNEYREPLFSQVKTYAAGGGHYAKLQRDDNSKAYLQTGWGDVKASKVMSSTSANYIHSLDSAIVHLGVLGLPEGMPFFSVHDCLACVPGTLSEVVPIFRRAFHNVVTSNPLIGLLEENDLLGVLEPPEQGDADIDQCLESPYMFC